MELTHFSTQNMVDFVGYGFQLDDYIRLILARKEHTEYRVLNLRRFNLLSVRSDIFEEVASVLALWINISYLKGRIDPLSIHFLRVLFIPCRVGVMFGFVLRTTSVLWLMTWCCFSLDHAKKQGEYFNFVVSRRVDAVLQCMIKLQITQYT